MIISRKFILPLALLALAASSALHAQTPVYVSVNHDNPSKTAIPSDFEGYSFEVVAADAGQYPNNVNWFSGSQTSLINMFKAIGVKTLRFGGSTMEEDGVDPYPSNADGAAVNDFANAIGANLIWGVPVGNDKYNLATYTSYAQALINDKDSKGYTFHTVFEVGNEPEAIDANFGGPVSSSTVDARFDSYLNSFKSAIFPSVSLGCCSPGSNPASYDNPFESDGTVVANKSNVGFVFAHNYPEGGAGSISASDAIAKMLSSNADSAYQSFYNQWGPAAVSAGFKPRIEETNSFYSGGVEGASDTYAAALWALDYMAYDATQTKIAGLDFFGGSENAYSSIIPNYPSATYMARGVAYGMLAFNVFGHGYPVQLDLYNPNTANVTAYSVLQNDGSESVLVVNRSYGTNSVDVMADIGSGFGYQNAQVMYLQQVNSDPALYTNITLGGQGIAGAGSWSGAYSAPTSISGGGYTVSVPHASAAIIHFYGTNTSQLIDNGTYVIANVNSGDALDDPGSSTTEGEAMQQYPVNNGNNQQWNLNNLGNNIVTLTNVASGQVLEVQGGTSANGGVVDQYPYQGNPWQQWQVVSVGSGAYELVNVHSGLLLDVVGASKASKAAIDQYVYKDGPWQQWKFQTP